MEKKIKKKWGDRYDGRRVRHSDPTNVVVPFIMRDRNDSEVLFDAEVDVSRIDDIIHDRRANGENIAFLDYFLAALVRTISQYPRINRFIAGRRLFARDSIDVSMVVKKDLNINTEETPVKFTFSPDATVDDISSQIRDIILSNKGGNEIKNDADRFMNIVNRLPRFLFSFAIWFFRITDFYGIMPKAIHKLSPFHSGIFVTNMGSIGADPIYHHIYNFGTVSVFIAIGVRRKQRVINKDGKIVERKMLKLRFVADERIADGFYLSTSLKYFTGLLARPDVLSQKPEKIVEDDQI